MIAVTVSLGLTRIREVFPMHLLRLLLKAWLVLGTVSVFLLFWLCKRTAATIRDPDDQFSPPDALR
jgi:hypothetical protein